MALPNETAVGRALLLMSTIPLAHKLVSHMFLLLFTRAWSSFRHLPLYKQGKITKNISKGLNYFLLSVLLFPTVIKLFSFWISAPHNTVSPVFDEHKVRLIMALLPAYYLFELLSNEKMDFYTWLHHTLVLLPSALVLSPQLYANPDDAKYTANFAMLLIFNSSLNFPLYFMYALSSTWEPCQAKYLFLMWRCIQLSASHIVSQTIIWPFYLSQYSHVGIIPSTLTIVMMVGQFIANFLGGLAMLAGARGVKRTMKKLEHMHTKSY